MKNSRIEHKIAAAKRYAKSWHRYPEMTPNGVVLYHSYPEEHKKTEGWWDDAAFRLGSQIVMVCWVHPRMRYSDMTSEIARAQMPPAPDSKFFEGGVKNYRRIGKNKNRKRLVSTTLTPFSGEFSEWCDLLNKRTIEIQETSDIQVRPEIKVTQCDWARLVDVCMPVEAVDAQSVEDMTLAVKDILAGNITLQDLFGDYVYDRNTWLSERKPGWGM